MRFDKSATSVCGKKVEALRVALIEGEESGVAGRLDMSKIKRQARAEAGLPDSVRQG